MTRAILRAVEHDEGSYRVAVQPPDPSVGGDRSYGRAEVEALAAQLDAELRWVSAPTDTRRADIDPLPRAAPNTDPWGGILPPGEEP